MKDGGCKPPLLGRSPERNPATTVQESRNKSFSGRCFPAKTLGFAEVA